MRRLPGTLFLFAIFLSSLAAQDSDKLRQIPLSTSKVLNTPSPGRIGAVNSFPGKVALSPDSHYAALLNRGYGTQATQAHQSITILDLATNQLNDFPDARLSDTAHQTYFLGLAFGSDGTHLYASMGSITGAGAKSGNTGNGIAVYKFENGKVSPEGFLKIAPQKIAAGKKVAFGVRKTAAGTAIPYPAGLAVIPGKSADRLLVANNLSDNVVLLDSRDRSVLQRFDLSTHEMIPSSFPHSRWPPRLVQSVELVSRGRTGSGEGHRDPLDPAAGAERSHRARFSSHRSSAQSG